MGRYGSIRVNPMNFMQWLKHFAPALKLNCSPGNNAMVGYLMVIKQNSFRETPEWVKGHNGENVIARLSRKRGWYVIPSYDYSGEDNKAPRLQGFADNYVIPDLDIAKDGIRKWAEVKTKREATWTNVTRRFEHGIPMRHYQHYLRVQDITGCEVWLFIYEEKTGVVLYANLGDLGKVLRPYIGTKMNRGGMAFFPRDVFKLWLNIYQLE